MSPNLLPLDDIYQIRSDQISRSVVSDSLRPHESQHARPPCPSPTLRVHSDSRPLSQWCHPAISSSVVPFSFCPQSLPASESFPMSQLSAWGGQSTGVSALASFLPKKSQGWSPSEWTGWISLQSKGLSRVFSNTTVQLRIATNLQFIKKKMQYLQITVKWSAIKKGMPVVNYSSMICWIICALLIYQKHLHNSCTAFEGSISILIQWYIF